MSIVKNQSRKIKNRQIVFQTNERPDKPVYLDNDDYLDRQRTEPNLTPALQT